LKESDTISIEELKQKLNEAENEKKALFKLISHDLRSPFNKVFALVNLIKMSDDQITDEQAKYLNMIELVISDSLGKMQNLMELRSIEGNGISTLYEKLNLSKLIQQSIDNHISSAQRKNINIFFEAQPVSLKTAKLSCLRILDQILSNAIKFSPADSDIAVAIEETELDVHVHITDAGYGIAVEEQPNLFKKFTILSPRPTGGESATGIGLYIVQYMAKNIGGSITYENSGKSTFSLRLPKSGKV